MNNAELDAIEARAKKAMVEPYDYGLLIQCAQNDAPALVAEVRRLRTNCGRWRKLAARLALLLKLEVRALVAEVQRLRQGDYDTQETQNE